MKILKNRLKAILAAAIIILMTAVTTGIAVDFNLAGTWALDATGTVEGATVDTPCCGGGGAQPGDCGLALNGPFGMGDADIHVTQSGNTLYASEGDVNGNPFILEGTITGNSVTFTITGVGINPCLPGDHETTYAGTVSKTNTETKIEGTFTGLGSWTGPTTEQYTWSGTFTVTIINLCAGCNDGDACNGVETCDPATGECIPGTPIICDVDHNKCTIEECVSPAGTCQKVDNVVCEDAPCVKCDPATGECTAPGVGQPHKMCDGACVNTQNDDYNCGDCRIACNTDNGEKCVNGVCKAPKPPKK